MPGCLEGSFVGLAEQPLEFGEHLLDGIEIRAVRWQEEQLGAGASDRLTNRFALVAAEVVHDDDIVGLEGRHQELLDISQEDVAIDRAVEDAGRVDSIVTERGNEGHGAPVSEGSLGIERLATSAPTMGPRHVGLGPGFINEDQTFGIEPALNPLPERTLARDVRAILFTCEQGFF